MLNIAGGKYLLPWDISNGMTKILIFPY